MITCTDVAPANAKKKRAHDDAGRVSQSYSVLLHDFRERPVQLHLKNVYACLGVGMLSAAAGGYVHLFTNVVQVRETDNDCESLYILLLKVSYRIILYDVL